MKWFGATGNGSTNDATAVQACLNAAQGRGGCVYAPKGNYVLNGQLTYSFSVSPSGLTLYGDGPDVTCFYWGSAQGISITYQTLYNSVTIKGISFLTGQQGGNTVALYLKFSGSNPDSANSAMNLIENCTFRGVDGYAQTDYWSNYVTISAVPNVNIVSCNFVAPNGQGTCGVYIAGTAATPPVVFNLTDCVFQGGNVALGYGPYVQGVSVTACNFTSCNYGVYTSTSEMNLVQLAISQSQFAAFTANIALGTYVADVLLTGNLFYGAKSQVSTNFSATNVISIIGNHFIGVSSGDTAIGITAIAGPVGGTITGNVFYDCGGQGIYLGSGTKNISVQSNLYTNCAAIVNDSGTANIIGGGSP